MLCDGARCRRWMTSVLLAIANGLAERGIATLRYRFHTWSKARNGRIAETGSRHGPRCCAGSVTLVQNLFFSLVAIALVGA